MTRKVTGRSRYRHRFGCFAVGGHRGAAGKLPPGGARQMGNFSISRHDLIFWLQHRYYGHFEAVRRGSQMPPMKPPRIWKNITIRHDYARAGTGNVLLTEPRA